MTNLEVWKASLDAEDFAQFMLESECGSCPAQEYCESLEADPPDDLFCGNVAREWADSECEQ